MLLPTIHTNGTSVGALLDAHMAALDALHAAIAAVIAAAPNGRDYYPQGPHAVGVAGAEHIARLGKLRDVQAELEAIVEHIVDHA